uniref:Uncharacterized protein n=1 Tax=Physcomitrium patens TaxID=3218 RepID=A0A2K1KA63_PHYPA|nr:hypothetical protein PHYPA_009856 [Physcomitrium patens]
MHAVQFLSKCTSSSRQEWQVTRLEVCSFGVVDVADGLVLSSQILVNRKP